MGFALVESSNINNSQNSNIQNNLKRERHEDCADEFEASIDEASALSLDKETVKMTIKLYLADIENEYAGKNKPDELIDAKEAFLHQLYSKLDTPAFFKACPKRDVILNEIKEQLIELTKFTEINKTNFKTDKSSYFDMQYDKYDFKYTYISGSIADNAKKIFDTTVKKQFSVVSKMNDKNELTFETPLRLNGAQKTSGSRPNEEFLYDNLYTEFDTTVYLSNSQNSNNVALPKAEELIADAKLLTGKEHKRFVNLSGKLTSLAKTALKNPETLKAVKTDIKKSPKSYLQTSEGEPPKNFTNALATHVIRQHILPEQFGCLELTEQNKSIKLLLEDIQKELNINNDALITDIKTDDINNNKHHKLIDEIKNLCKKTSMQTWSCLIKSFAPQQADKPDNDGDVFEDYIEVNAQEIYMSYMTAGHWLDINDIALLDKYFLQEKQEPITSTLAELTINLVYDYESKNGSHHWTPAKVENENIPNVAPDGNCGITSVLLVHSKVKI